VILVDRLRPLFDVIRPIVRSDLPALEQTLVAAFHEDPLIRWLFPDEASRAEKATRYFRVNLEAGLRSGHAYATDANRAVAVWSPPEVALADDAGAFLGFLDEELGERARAALRGLAAAATADLVHVPSFYLKVLGTLPTRQGLGIGGRLLRHIIDRCDARGIPAYLESSNIRNLTLYERHGFRVVDEVVVPDGPVIWSMWRDPMPGV
jgi:GNAT superfamily N-acetyltransferase